MMKKEMKEKKLEKNKMKLIKNLKEGFSKTIRECLVGRWLNGGMEGWGDGN